MTEPLDADLGTRMRRAYEEDGATIHELAELHDLTPTTTQRLLHAAGTTVRPRGPKRLPPASPEMIAAFAEEPSYAAVGRKFGEQPGRVRRMLLRAGVELPAPGDL